MILFVGDKPSPKMKPGATAFKGAACEQRLMEWISSLGLEGTQVKIINSTGPWIDTMFYLAFHSGAPIIALGNNASKKLAKRHFSHYKLPHPSGRNRQTNDALFIKRKLAECKQWLKEQNGTTKR